MTDTGTSLTCVCVYVYYPPAIETVQMLHEEDCFSARGPGVPWVVTRLLYAKPVPSTQLNYNQSE